MLTGLLNVPRPSPVRQDGIRFGNANTARGERIDAHLRRTETPGFQNQLTNTFVRAQDYIQAQLRQGQRGFVIFDIDETVLDNRGYFREAGYYKKAPGPLAIYESWDRWVSEKRIPVIPAAKKLIDWLNANRVPYVFLTGIQEHLAASSKANLKQVGVWGASCLGAFYKPDDCGDKTYAFKIKQRQLLETRFGMPIMASLGDRPSDMTGTPAKDFLLPSYVAELRRENDAV